MKTSVQSAAKRAGCFIISAIIVIVALELLRDAYIAFVNLEFSRYSDYARYTNMLWNTAYGRFLFSSFDQASYLKTHLSFTLALLAPLFHVWDHPALLLVVQWLFLAAGGLFLIGIGKKLALPWIAILSLLLFWIAHHFTQYVILREFHGVSLYFLLIPALYYCLIANRQLVWIPFLLILGLREETGLLIAPLLFYFAHTEKWREGYWYAGTALVYVAFATLILYPWINDISLFARRQEEFGASAMDDYFSATVFQQRFTSLALILLPLAPLLQKSWRPVFVFMAAPILLTLGSTEPTQVQLRHHYPAVIVAFSAIAILHVKPRALFSAWLIAVVTWSFYTHGLVRGTRPEDWKKTYQQIDPSKEEIYTMTRTQIPKQGVLFFPKELRSFVANRAEIGSSKTVDYPDNAIVVKKQDRLDADLRAGISNGTWRTICTNELYVVLQKRSPKRRP